jgi:hypothetical protein
LEGDARWEVLGELLGMLDEGTLGEKLEKLVGVSDNDLEGDTLDKVLGDLLGVLDGGTL